MPQYELAARAWCEVRRMLALLLLAAAAAGAAVPPPPPQVALPQVEKMPNLPRNYRYTDWAGVALRLDEWLFGAPPALGLWCAGNASGRSASYSGPAWGIPSYAGADRAPCNIQGPCLPETWEPGEGIPLMGTLLTSAYLGVDKSAPVARLNGSSYLDSVFMYVGPADVPLVSDHVLWPGQPVGVAGSSWYALYPNILFAHLASALPEAGRSRQRLLAVIEQQATLWPKVVQGFATAPCGFNSTGFNFGNWTPYQNGKWYEQDSAVGLGLLSVTTASALFGNLSDPRAAELVAAADTALEWLESWPNNPLYEVLASYGAVTAARMNREAPGGRSYNVTRLLGWALGDGLDCPKHTRHGWGVIADRWGDEDIGGLVGSTIGGGGYAFAGDGFWFVKAIVPLPRYAPQFARTIGKWMLNHVHSARFFYWPNLKPDRQLSTAKDGLMYDPHGLIAYEGLRKCDYNRTGKPEPHCEHGENFGPYGEADTTGDVCSHRGITPANGSAYAACEVVGRSCTLGLYGGVFVGVLGRVVTPTNVSGILMIDAVSTDIFPTGSLNPTWTMYNPWATRTIVAFNMSAMGLSASLRTAGFDLLDLVSSTVVATGCGGGDGGGEDKRGECAVLIEADSALVVEALHKPGVGLKADDDECWSAGGTRVQLNSSALQVEIVVGANFTAPTWLSSLKINQRPAWPDSPSAWTGNIVVGMQQWGGPQFDVQNDNELISWSLSGTGLYSLDDSGSSGGSMQHGYGSRGGHITHQNGTAVVVDGILVGPVDRPWATERWTLALEQEQGGLSWDVQRMFICDVSVIADKTPALALPHTIPHGVGGRPNYTASRGPQTIGFLDQTMVLNGSGTDSGGFWIATHGGNFSWMEVVSPERAQLLRLAPSGMALRSTQTAGLFSFSNAQCPYNINGPCWWPIIIGIDLLRRIDNLTACTAASAGCNSTLMHAGQKQASSWSLQSMVDPGVSVLDLTIPLAPKLAQSSKAMATVYNQWRGWTHGNSPNTVTCWHEMNWWTMAQGAFSVSSTVASAYSKYFKWQQLNGVNWQNGTTDYGPKLPYGWVAERWDPRHFEIGSINDQNPMSILAYYYHIMATGDKSFMRHSMPVMDAVAKMIRQTCNSSQLVTDPLPGVGRFNFSADDPALGALMVSMGRMSTGTGNRSGGENWWDVVGFGGWDSWTNVWVVAAWDALADMKRWSGDTAGAAEFEALFERSKHAFNEKFWDVERGGYADWVDIQGTRHYHFFTATQSMAVLVGIANRSQTEAILHNFDALYEQLYMQYNLTADQLWCTPSNFLPLLPSEMGGAKPQGHFSAFPGYENGVCFFFNTGLEIAMWGHAGSPDTAFEKYRRFMEQGWDRDGARLWGQHFAWTKRGKSGTSNGFASSDVLTNVLLSLWGFTRGSLGVWPRLSDGVVVRGAPAQLLEGATHRFAFLGRDVTATVEGGKVEING
jgi:hypothetical protein